jgi:hypothetical protein
MMRNKKIALLASILVVTLVVGVYALVLSNTLTASWTLRESGTNLVLYWADGEPSGDLYRGQWIQTKIGLRNDGLATYTVSDKFKIYTVASGLPSGCVTIEYNEDDGTGWHDMTDVLTGWGSNTLTGYFGPPAGFTVGPGYNVQTWFRIMFNGNAPIDVGYYFESWVEQV